MVAEFGKRIWFFPDGDIPLPGEGDIKGHESLILLNPNENDAEITITVYFTEASPKKLNGGTLLAQRVRCIRTNEPLDGFQIPFGQYALKVESTVGIIAQIGRMDVTHPNLAYYTVMGFPI